MKRNICSTNTPYDNDCNKLAKRLQKSQYYFSNLYSFSLKTFLTALAIFGMLDLQAQSSDCVPGSVLNDNDDSWSEQCYLGSDCEEQGNPCQANDVVMLGAFVANASGGPVETCETGEERSFYLWGKFHNNTSTSRYAVRTCTEVWLNNAIHSFVNECSFDELQSGDSDVILLGEFNHSCGDLIQLVNTWVGWSTTHAQCSDAEGEDYSAFCGQYPPAKCSKELGAIQLLVPNFAFACGTNNNEGNTEVHFTDLSAGGDGPLSCVWDFGDGNTSTLHNTTHHFASSSGSYTVRLTVTDQQGISAAAEFELNLDSLSCCFLSLECPDPDGGLFACLDELPPPDQDLINILDSCGQCTYTIIDSSTGSGCPGDTMYLTRTYIITDGISTDSCVQVFRFIDDIAPGITCPANVTVSCASMVPPSNIPAIEASDNCGGEVTVTVAADVINNSSCANSYTITRVYTAVDACENSTSCAQIITVNDNIPPSMTCLANVTVSCASAVPPSNTSAIITSDNCGGTANVTVAPDIITNIGCPNNYTITRVYTATDGCENTSTCTQIIMVDDNTPPSITCMANITVSCAANVPTPNISAIVTSDNCGGGVNVTVSADAITNSFCTNGYTITRIYTATDACGNTATCAQSIVVDDNIPPAITCPVNVTVSCSNAVPAPNLSSVITSDNCGGGVTVTVAADVISNILCVNNYTITRRYTATDACGNAMTCEQTIVVNDLAAPTITCPADITVSCAGNVPAANPSAINAVDNCDGDLTITVAPDVITSGICANSYTITRIYTASDECGNTNTCAQTIVVDDNNPPSITCPENLTVSCANDVPAADISAVVTSDLCGGVTISVAADVISNSICSNSYTITRVYTAVDACDNSATCAQVITVSDIVPPSISCIADITVSCASAVPAPDISAIITSDNCGNAASVTVASDVISDLSCLNSYTISRVYTATDACGNSVTCAQIITVDDQVAPTIVTCPADLNVACAEDVPGFEPGDIVATDNCAGDVTVGFVEVVSNQTCINDFTLTRTYTVADVCGNTATCLQTIVVADTLPPGLITCPPDITLSCSEGIPHPDTTGVTILDNCDGEMSIQVTDVLEGPPCNFTLVRTYFASDACGNSASCVQVITFIDTIAPLIEFADPLLQGMSNGDTLLVQCQGQNSNWDLPQFDENSINASDNCNTPLNVGFQQSLMSQGDCILDGYINVYRLEWSAIDSCQNNSEAFLFMKLMDTIPPVLHGVPADVTVDVGSMPDLPTVYATDECLCACAMMVEESALQAGCLDGQTITRTWRAMDDCGNISSKSQTITFRDTAGPALLVELPDMQPISNGDQLIFNCSEGGIPSLFESMNVHSMGFTDLSGPVNVSFDKDEMKPSNCEFFGFMEQHVFNWEALDACGNAADFSFTVQLTDDVAPEIINVPAMACMNDPVLELIEAVDCAQSSMRFWDVPVVNTCGEGMAIHRTYEAFDLCGNMSRDTVMLIPDDNISPLMSFTHPLLSDLNANDTITVQCQSNGIRMTTFDAAAVNAIDGCMENIVVEYSERMISSFDCVTDGRVGLMELNWTATDVCGNFSTLSLMANVVDDTGPTLIDFKDSITIGCQEEMPVIKAIDNCGNVASLIYNDSIVPGPCVYEYDIIRQISAKDECGNVTEAKQIIHVGDRNGPVISGVIEQLCDDLTMPPVKAFDQCAGVFVEVSMVQDTMVDVCVDGMVIRRTWSAVDGCNHVTEIEQFIVMGDTTPPEIMIPSYSIIYDFMDLDTIPMILMSQDDILDKLNALDGRSILVMDDCDNEIFPVFDLQVIVSSNVNQDGFTEQRRYKWLASDICGNMDSVSMIVNIMDDIPPVMELPDNMTIICSPLPPPHHMLPEDSSDIVTVTFTETIQPGSEHGEFMVIRTWIVTDMSGNSSEIVQHIRWIPDTFLECDIVLPDTVECNSHGVRISSNVTGGISPYTYWWEIKGDECFIQGGQRTPEIDIYVGWHPVNIRLFVADSFGCTTMCETELVCETIQHGMEESFISNSSGPAYDEDNLKSLSFWPNPAYESVNVSFESKDKAEVHVTLMDFMGRHVLEDRFTANKGQNEHILDVHKLGIGPYILQVESEDQRYTKRIVIMD